MAEGQKALLQVTGVTKRFARRRPWGDVLRRPFAEEWVDALQDVSIDVREGEFFGLLGANGAGKTTLMKVIATLMLPDSGRVLVDGRDAERDASGVRELVALSLATERGLYWRLTGRENLALFAELFMLPRSEVQRRVDEALDAVGLLSSGVADRMVSEYSSGMTQRLLIARALMTRPRVLLLDEPTRSLDPVSAREFRAFLREELSRRGCAVLLATHNADEAFGLCDRVSVMANGRVLATGAATDLAHAVVGRRHQLVTTEPGHPAFAELIGSGDLVDASPDEEVESPGPWRRLRLTIPGGDAEAARLLAVLHLRGVPVASFSPQATTLADLIEGVVGSRSGGGPG